MGVEFITDVGSGSKIEPTPIHSTNTVIPHTQRASNMGGLHVLDERHSTRTDVDTHIAVSNNDDTNISILPVKRPNKRATLIPGKVTACNLLSRSDGGGGSHLAGTTSVSVNKDDTVYEADLSEELGDVLEAILCVWQCIACGHLFENADTDEVERPKVHPCTVDPNVRLACCKTCYKAVKNMQFTVDDEGMENECQVCGDCGDIFLCSKCPRGVCQLCIARNMDHETQALVQDDAWQCIGCEPQQLGTAQYVINNMLQDRNLAAYKLLHSARAASPPVTPENVGGDRAEVLGTGADINRTVPEEGIRERYRTAPAAASVAEKVINRTVGKESVPYTGLGGQGSADSGYGGGGTLQGATGDSVADKRMDIGAQTPAVGNTEELSQANGNHGNLGYTGPRADVSQPDSAGPVSDPNLLSNGCVGRTASVGAGVGMGMDVRPIVGSSSGGSEMNEIDEGQPTGEESYDESEDEEDEPESAGEGDRNEDWVKLCIEQYFMLISEKDNVEKWLRASELKTKRMEIRNELISDGEHYTSDQLESLVEEEMNVFVDDQKHFLKALSRRLTLREACFFAAKVPLMELHENQEERKRNMELDRKNAERKARGKPPLSEGLMRAYDSSDSDEDGHEVQAVVEKPWQTKKAERLLKRLRAESRAIEVSEKVAYNAKTGEKVNIHDLNSIQDQIDRLGSAKIDVIDPLDIEEDENKVVRESQNGRIKGRDINVALLAERNELCAEQLEMISHEERALRELQLKKRIEAAARAKELADKANDMSGFVASDEGFTDESDDGLIKRRVYMLNGTTHTRTHTHTHTHTPTHTHTSPPAHTHTPKNSSPAPDVRWGSHVKRDKEKAEKDYRQRQPTTAMEELCAIAERQGEESDHSVESFDAVAAEESVMIADTQPLNDDLPMEAVKISEAEKALRRTMKARKRLIIRNQADMNSTITQSIEEKELPYQQKGMLIANPLDPPEDHVYLHPFFDGLRDHQREGLQFMWKQLMGPAACFDDPNFEGDGAILAHMMGLGKTIQVVTLLHTAVTTYMQRKVLPMPIKRILILVPKNVFQNWFEEFEKWLPPDSVLRDYLYMDQPADRHANIQKWYDFGGVYLMSHQGYTNMLKPSVGYKEINDIPKESDTLAMVKCLSDPGPDVLVIDEAHVLKNPLTATLKCLARLRTKRRICVTGNPMQNNFTQYYEFVHFVKPKVLGRKAEFNRDFCKPIEKAQSNLDTASTRDIEDGAVARHLLHKTLEGLMHRRGFQENLSGTSMRKREYTIVFQPSKIQEKLIASTTSDDWGNSLGPILSVQMLGPVLCHPVTIQRLKVGEIDSIETDEDEIETLAKEDESNNADKTRAHWRRIIHNIDDKELKKLKHGPKTDFAMALIKEAIAVGDKILVFSNFLANIQLIADLLVERKIEFLTITGQTSASVRQQYSHLFNDSRQKYKVFLVSTMAGNAGLNLYGANRVILMDVSWNPTNDTQAVYRAFRIGQEKANVYVYRLVMDQSPERTVYWRNILKETTAIEIIDKQTTDARVESKNLKWNRERIHDLGMSNSETGQKDFSLVSDAVFRKAGMASTRKINAWHNRDKLISPTGADVITKAQKDRVDNRARARQKRGYVSSEYDELPQRNPTKKQSHRPPHEKAKCARVAYASSSSDVSDSNTSDSAHITLPQSQRTKSVKQTKPAAKSLKHHRHNEQPKNKPTNQIAATAGLPWSQPIEALYHDEIANEGGDLQLVQEMSGNLSAHSHSSRDQRTNQKRRKSKKNKRHQSKRSRTNSPDSVKNRPPRLNARQLAIQRKNPFASQNRFDQLDARESRAGANQIAKNDADSDISVTDYLSVLKRKEAELYSAETMDNEPNTAKEKPVGAATVTKDTIERSNATHTNTSDSDAEASDDGNTSDNDTPPRAIPNAKPRPFAQLADSDSGEERSTTAAPKEQIDVSAATTNQNGPDTPAANEITPTAASTNQSESINRTTRPPHNTTPGSGHKRLRGPRRSGRGRRMQNADESAVNDVLASITADSPSDIVPIPKKRRTTQHTPPPTEHTYEWSSTHTGETRINAPHKHTHTHSHTEHTQRDRHTHTEHTERDRHTHTAALSPTHATTTSHTRSSPPDTHTRTHAHTHTSTHPHTHTRTHTHTNMEGSFFPRPFNSGGLPRSGRSQAMLTRVNKFINDHVKETNDMTKPSGPSTDHGQGEYVGGRDANSTYHTQAMQANSTPPTGDAESNNNLPHQHKHTQRETELHGGNNAPNTSTSTHSHSHPGHEVGVSAREGTDRDAVSVHLTTPERLDRAQIQQAQPLLQQQLAESESKTEIKPTSASDDEEMRQIEVEQALLQVMDNASPSITAQMSTNNDTATAQQQPDPLGVGISSQHTRKLTDTNSADELKSLREAIDERGSFIHHKRTSPPTSSTPPPRLISARGPHMGVPNDRNRTGATSAVQLPVIAAMASAADGDDAEYQKLLQRHRAQGDTAASIFGTRSDEDILPTSSVGSIQPQPQPKPNPNPTATLSPKVIGGGPTVNRGLPNASSTANQVFTKEPMAYSTAAEAKQGANNMSQNSAPDPSENGPKRVLTHKVLPATGDKAAEAVYRLPMGSPGSRNKLSPTLQATQQMPQINSQSRKHTLTDTPTHHTAHPPPGQGQANPKAKVRPTWEADNRATHSGVRPTQITRTKAATGRGARIISKVLTHARLSAAGGAKTKAGLHIGPALDTGLSGGANMIILGDDDADTTTNTNAHGPKTQTTPDDSEAIVID